MGTDFVHDWAPVYPHLGYADPDDWMMFHFPCSRQRLRINNIIALIWLVYLIYPTIGLITLPLSSLERVLGFAGAD